MTQITVMGYPLWHHFYSNKTETPKNEAKTVRHTKHLTCFIAILRHQTFSMLNGDQSLQQTLLLVKRE